MADDNFGGVKQRGANNALSAGSAAGMAANDPTLQKMHELDIENRRAEDRMNSGGSWEPVDPIDKIENPILKAYSKIISPFATAGQNVVEDVKKVGTDIARVASPIAVGLYGNNMKQQVYKDFITEDPTYKRVRDDLIPFGRAGTSISYKGISTPGVSFKKGDEDQFVGLGSTLSQIYDSDEYNDFQKGIMAKDAIDSTFSFYGKKELKDLDDKDYQDIAVTAIDYANRINKVNDQISKVIDKQKQKYGKSTSRASAEMEKQEGLYGAFNESLTSYINNRPIDPNNKEQIQKRDALNNGLEKLIHELAEPYVAKRVVEDTKGIPQEQRDLITRQANEYYTKVLPYFRALADAYLDPESKEKDLGVVANKVAKEMGYNNFTDAVGYHYDPVELNSWVQGTALGDWFEKQAKKHGEGSLVINPGQYFKMLRDDITQLNGGRFDRLMNKTAGEFGQTIRGVTHSVVPTIAANTAEGKGLVNRFSPLQMAEIQNVTRQAIGKKDSKALNALYSVSNAIPQLLAIAGEVWVGNKAAGAIGAEEALAEAGLLKGKDLTKLIKNGEKIGYEFVENITDAEKVAQYSNGQAKRLVDKAFATARGQINRIPNYTARKLMELAYTMAENYAMGYSMNQMFDTPYTTGTPDFFVDTIFGFTEMFTKAAKMALNYKLDPVKYAKKVKEGFTKQLFNIGDKEWKKLPGTTRASLTATSTEMINKWDNALKEAGGRSEDLKAVVDSYVDVVKDEIEKTQDIQKLIKKKTPAVEEGAGLNGYYALDLIDDSVSREVAQKIYDEVGHEGFWDLTKKAIKNGTSVAIEFLRKTKKVDSGAKRLFGDLDKVENRVLQRNLANLFVDGSAGAIEKFENKMGAFIEDLSTTKKTWKVARDFPGSPETYLGDMGYITIDGTKYKYYMTKSPGASATGRSEASALYTLIPTDDPDLIKAMDSWNSAPSVNRAREIQTKDGRVLEIRDLPRIAFAYHSAKSDVGKELGSGWKYIVNNIGASEKKGAVAVDFQTIENTLQQDIKKTKFKNPEREVDNLIEEQQIGQMKSAIPEDMHDEFNRSYLVASDVTYRNSPILFREDSEKVSNRILKKATQDEIARDMKRYLESTSDNVASYNAMFALVKRMQKTNVDDVVLMPMNSKQKLPVDRITKLDGTNSINFKKKTRMKLANVVLAPNDWEQKSLFTATGVPESSIITPDNISKIGKTDIVAVEGSLVDDPTALIGIEAKSVVSEPGKIYAGFVEVGNSGVYSALSASNVIEESNRVVAGEMINSATYDPTVAQSKVLEAKKDFNKTVDYNTSAYDDIEQVEIRDEELNRVDEIHYGEQKLESSNMVDAIQLSKKRDKAIEIFGLSADGETIKMFSTKNMISNAREATSYDNFVSLYMDRLPQNKLETKEAIRFFTDDMLRVYSLVSSPSVEEVTNITKKYTPIIGSQGERTGEFKMESLKTPAYKDRPDSLAWLGTDNKIEYEYFEYSGGLDEGKQYAEESMMELYKHKLEENGKVAILIGDTKPDFIVFDQADIKRHLLEKISDGGSFLDGRTDREVTDILEAHVIMMGAGIDSKILKDGAMDIEQYKKILSHPESFKDSIAMGIRKYNKKLFTGMPAIKEIGDESGAGLWVMLFKNPTASQDGMSFIKPEHMDLIQGKFGTHNSKSTSKLHVNGKGYSLKGLFIKNNTDNTKAMIMTELSKNITIAREGIIKKANGVGLEDFAVVLDTKYGIKIDPEKMEEGINALDIEDISKIVNGEFDIVGNEHLYKKFIKPKTEEEKEFFSNVHYDDVFTTDYAVRYYLNDGVLPTKTTTAKLYQQIFQNIFDHKTKEVFMQYFVENGGDVEKVLKRFALLKENKISELSQDILADTSSQEIWMQAKAMDVQKMTAYLSSQFKTQVSGARVKGLGTFMLGVNEYANGLINSHLQSKGLEGFDFGKDSIVYLHRDQLTKLSPAGTEWKHGDKIVAIRAPVTNSANVGAHKLIIIDDLPQELQEIMHSNDAVYVNGKLAEKINGDFDGDLIMIFPELSKYKGKGYKKTSFGDLLYNITKDLKPAKEPKAKLDTTIKSYNDAFEHTIISKSNVGTVTATTRPIGIIFSLLADGRKETRLLFNKASDELGKGIQAAVDAAVGGVDKYRITKEYQKLFNNILPQGQNISGATTQMFVDELAKLASYLSGQTYNKLVNKAVQIDATMKMFQLLGGQIKKLDTSIKLPISKNEIVEVADLKGVTSYLMKKIDQKIKFSKGKLKKLSINEQKKEIKFLSGLLGGGDRSRVIGTNPGLKFVLDSGLHDNVFTGYAKKSYQINAYMKTKLYVDVLPDSVQKNPMIPNILKQVFAKDKMIEGKKFMGKTNGLWGFTYEPRNQGAIIEGLSSIKSTDPEGVIATAILTLEPPRRVDDWIKENYPGQYKKFMELKYSGNLEDVSKVLDDDWDTRLSGLHINKQVDHDPKIADEILEIKKEYNNKTTNDILALGDEYNYIDRSAIMANPEGVLFDADTTRKLNSFIVSYKKNIQGTGITRVSSLDSVSTTTENIKRAGFVLIPSQDTRAADITILQKKPAAFIGDELAKRYEENGYIVKELHEDFKIETGYESYDALINEWGVKAYSSLAERGYTNKTKQAFDTMFGNEVDQLDNITDTILASGINKKEKVYIALPDPETKIKQVEVATKNTDSSIAPLYNICDT